MRDSLMKDRESTSTLQENIYKTLDKHELELKDLKVRKIITKITRDKRCSVLDVGCGDGSLLEPFSKHQDCYGVDISEAQLERAQDKNIKTFRIDLETEKLPFPQDFFDLVICSETIEHLLDADNLLQEVNRVLRTKGSFILTFPNVNQPISWLVQVVFDLPPVYSARYKSPHVRDYTLRMVKNILVDFGFNILNVSGTYIYPFKGRFSQWLAKSFPRLAEKIVVVSRKHRKIHGVQPRKVVWNVLELIKKDKHA